MDNKRILIGLTYYKPNVSGLTVYVERMINGMSDLRYQISVITAKYTKTEEEKNVIRVPGFKLGKGFIMPLYIYEALKEVKKTDIVWCHLPAAESPVLALACKLFNKKLIITYHCYFDSGNTIFNKLIEWWQNIALTAADKIVVNSLDYIEGYGLLKSFRQKVVEIYPPIEVDTRSQISDIRKKNKSIGFLGRLSKEKNVELLVEAMKYLPEDYRLIMAGSRKAIGEDKYMRKIEELIRTDRRINDMGEIKNQCDLFNIIDCLVLPSNNRLESFGMVSAEAIISRVPTIVSDTPGVRVPVIASEGGELFQPDDPKDLADKIKKVMSYKNYSPKINVFDTNKTIKAYQKLF